MSLEVLFSVGVLVTRTLQILVGVLLCVLGYRLFQQVPTSNSNAEVTLSEHLRINLSKIGPGVFFALFGTVILIQTLANPLRLEHTSNAGKSAAVPTNDHVIIAGQRPDTTAAECATLSLEQLQPQLRFLNGIAGLLRQGLSIEQHANFENDQREAKIALMAGAWNKRWGDFTAFAAWARGQPSDAPNPEAKTIWETK